MTENCGLGSLALTEETLSFRPVFVSCKQTPERQRYEPLKQLQDSVTYDVTTVTTIRDVTCGNIVMAQRPSGGPGPQFENRGKNEITSKPGPKECSKNSLSSGHSHCGLEAGPTFKD